MFGVPAVCGFGKSLPEQNEALQLAFANGS
jgi:hypothetical protein